MKISIFYRCWKIVSSLFNDSWGSYREVSISFRYYLNFARLLFHASWIHAWSFKNIDYPESKKIIIEIKLKKKLNTEFPMLLENSTTFFITVNKYFLPLQSNFFVRFKADLTSTLHPHFISQNLEAMAHPVPEIKNYNDYDIGFSHKYTWILWQNYTLWHRKRWRI